MPKTILQMLWPYVLRYLAQRSADYLDERREKKRQLKQLAASVAEAVTVAPGYECLPLPSQTRPPAVNALWYTLGGILLGSAIALILVNVLREEG